MGDRLSPITYRTANGFGEATNNAISESSQTFARSDPPLQATPKFLALPDELVLAIGLFVDDTRGNQVLRNLALTCRRFRDVAREALIRNVVLTPKAVRRYVNVLYEHPEYLAKLGGSLELHTSQEPDVCERLFLGSKFHRDCCWFLNKYAKPSYGVDWAGELGVNDTLSRSAYIAILILAMPKLTSLFVTDSFIEQSMLLSSSSFVGLHRAIFSPSLSIPRSQLGLFMGRTLLYSSTLPLSCVLWR